MAQIDFSMLEGIEIRKGAFGGFAVFSRPMDADIEPELYAGFTDIPSLAAWLQETLTVWQKAEDED